LPVLSLSIAGKQADIIRQQERTTDMGLNFNDLYNDLRPHIGHELECVGYRGENDDNPVNIAIECITCGCVLLDANTPAYIIHDDVDRGCEGMDDADSNGKRYGCGVYSNAKAAEELDVEYLLVRLYGPSEEAAMHNALEWCNTNGFSIAE
tara:strand:- start:15582 stop:16034 length:453 start_codon:yes stop_codon:yes gene_type:complete